MAASALGYSCKVRHQLDQRPRLEEHQPAVAVVVRQGTERLVPHGHLGVQPPGLRSDAGERAPAARCARPRRRSALNRRRTSRRSRPPPPAVRRRPRRTALRSSSATCGVPAFTQHHDLLESGSPDYRDAEAAKLCGGRPPCAVTAASGTSAGRDPVAGVLLPPARPVHPGDRPRSASARWQPPASVPPLRRAADLVERWLRGDAVGPAVRPGCWPAGWYPAER